MRLRSRSSHHFKDGPVMALAKQATSLKTLTLETFTARELCLVFWALRELEMNGAGKAQALVPQLRTLVLKECEFDADIAGPALRRALIYRVLLTDIKLKLDTVTFAGCLAASDSERVAELKAKLVGQGLICSFLNTK